MLLDRPQELRDRYAAALMEDVIPFWMRHSPDPEYGGYFTCLGRDGAVFDTDKFVWLQARQVWMFSKLYRTVDPRAEFLDIAALGARFLAEHGRDERGDWYFALDRRGTPLVQPYSIFSDCFAAMGFAEYAHATGETRAAKIATESFERVLARWENPKGQYNKLVPGSRPLRSLALPMIAVNLAMEMGSALPDYPVEETVRENLRTIIEVFVDRRARLIFEHVSPDGGHPDTFEGRMILPGHGIECMWFVMSAAEQLGDTATIELAADALEDQLAFGWDEEFGGIYYYLDAQGKPLQQLEWDRKLWWPHIEALIALVLGWHLTRRPKLAEWYERVHEYTWSHFPDPEYGEWWGYLDRRGEVFLPLKGGKWKGCFHVPRGLLWCMRALERIAAAGGK